MTHSLSQKLLNRLGDKPAQMAFRLSNTAMIRRRLGRRYEAALATHGPVVPTLPYSDQEIVERVERDGIFVTSLDALGLPGSAEMVPIAQRVAADYADEARRQAQSGREFLSVPPSAILANGDLFRWGLNQRLLAIAEAYLGLSPAYDGTALVYTVADGTELGPRQWHRDREDRKMLKVAVYCSDVTDRGGPFELISRVDRSQGVADRYDYMFGTEQELTTRLGADYRSAIVSCTGPVGTVVFADTARFFHRGAPAHDKDRATLFYSYFARQTRHPFFCERSGLTHKEIAELTQGLSRSQRTSALWHDTLPIWLKLIPSAPV